MLLPTLKVLANLINGKSHIHAKRGRSLTYPELI